ncbi:MAG TPA: 16S rRNA (adenine(1518)-N(6)/adenine(1519)-N(6))-dimethyltransferase RsmA, partial [Polyangiaceae bacterium]|nr:16S rRNA (adenine(1518)-N(6)/adenine(1519)-N(6))-dimethyltransferase RsmA [Polyangiaceae bacterium]
MPPKRSLSQNFLSDPRILDRIADIVGATKDVTVLEIGPGKGALTRPLLERAGRVVAIEKDRDLLSALRSRLPDLVLAEGDALEMDWHALVGGPFIVCGNIPYNITSPLIDKALTPPRPARVVYLVQKEVAERVAAGPGSKEYGALSVGVQAVAKPERLFTVPKGAFFPAPKVDSAVLRMTPLAEPLIGDDEVEPFRRFVVGLFGYRRKQLLRALREHLGLDAEQGNAIVARAGFEPTMRAEELSPEEFVELFRASRHPA